MAAWIFQGNPDRFDIDGYLRAGLSRISWGVDRYLDRYRIGDVIYFWRAGGERRSVSGVIASGRVNSDVWQGPSEPEAARFWTTPGDTGARQRVWVVVDKIANEKEILKRDWLAEDPVFKDHPLFTVRVGTSFSLSLEQEERLRDLWRRTGIDWDRADIVAALYAYAFTRERAGQLAIARLEVCFEELLPALAHERLDVRHFPAHLHTCLLFGCQEVGLA